MTNKDVVLKAVYYIEANLKTEISILDISHEVCYSLYHFIRLFQSVTGHSPKSYLQLRRLTEAVYELRDTNKKISDIAFGHQFGSHESFTRAIRKQFNVNPTDIRNGHSLSTIGLLSPINSEYIYQSDKARNMPPEIVELDERTLVGLSFFISDDSQINDLSKEWNRLTNEVAGLGLEPGKEKFYQLQFWSEQQDIGGLYFFIGFEANPLSINSPMFVQKIIPSGRYLRFIHKGLANKVGYTYRYIYNQFLPDTDYKLTKSFNFEFYGDKCTGPYDENSESEIYIPIE